MIDGKEITNYIREKSYFDEKNGCEVMSVNDVGLLVSSILKDTNDDLTYVNKILEANTSMLQKLLRKDGVIE